MKSLRLLLVCLLLPAGFALAADAEEIEGFDASPQAAPAEIHSQEPADLAPLRHFQEGSLLLLKRYAMLEALISAVERGRQENQAFLIGASSVIPGTGQMINGDYLQGGLLLFASGMSAATIRQLEFTRRERSGTQDLLPWYYASLALRNGITSYAMLHAANASYRSHRDRTAAMWTGTASLLPGAGQAINGDWWEAGAFLAAYTFSALITARLEEEIYPSGDDHGYLVRQPAAPEWSLACLPGGGAISVSAEW